MVHIVRHTLAIRRIQTTLSENLDCLIGQEEPPCRNHLRWMGEARQEPGKRCHSPNWGTLGLPPQTEEQYFTLNCTLYTYCTQFFKHIFAPSFYTHFLSHNVFSQLFCTIFPKTFSHNFSLNFPHYLSTHFSTGSFLAKKSFIHFFQKNCPHNFQTNFFHPHLPPNFAT